MGVKVFRLDKDYVRIPHPIGDKRVIVWPGVGAKYGSFNFFKMKAGNQSLPHVHDSSEDIFYVLQGKGTIVDLNKEIEYSIEKGCVVFVEPGTRHVIKSLGKTDYADIGAICPPDINMYKKAGLKW